MSHSNVIYLATKTTHFFLLLSWHVYIRGQLQLNRGNRAGAAVNVTKCLIGGFEHLATNFDFPFKSVSK